MHQVFRITLDDALPMLQAARAKAEELGVKQTICVCDDGGNVLALHRLPGARLTGVEISIAKAFTAAGHERATHSTRVTAPVRPAWIRARRSAGSWSRRASVNASSEYACGIDAPQVTVHNSRQARRCSLTIARAGVQPPR